MFTSGWLVAPAAADPGAGAPENTNRCTIVGTDGDDVLRGTRGDDVICGLGGNDRIHGLGGDDVLHGGPGNDVLIGGPGNDHLRGGQGRDHLDGGTGNDLVRGGRGADTVIGGKGSDDVRGGIGTDVVAGGTGADRLAGGPGNDELRARERRGPSDTVVCGPGSDAVSADPFDRVTPSCEKVEQHRRPTAITLSGDEVAEEEPAGTFVGNLSATDPDTASTHTFALVPGSGTGTGSLRIDGARLVTTAPLDHETTPALTFAVRATDSTGLSIERPFTITVTDADEPASAVDDTFTVDEDSTPNPLDVLANDADPEGAPLSITTITSPAHGTAIRSGNAITYQPDPDFCSVEGATDSFTYTLSDGVTATVTVSVTCLPDAPVLETSAGTTAYAEGDPATAVDPGLTLSDVDLDGEITGATVAISAGFAAGQDVLALGGTHAGITASYAAGTLTLDGEATPAAYQAALRAVTYANGSEAPNTAGRTLSVHVVDDAGLDDSATRAVSVQAVNDAPVITAPASFSALEDAAAQLSGLSLADVDAGTSPLSVALAVVHGRLDLSSITGLTFLVGDGSSDAAMSFEGTLADVNAALAGMSYLANANYSGPETLSITVGDLGNTGSGGVQFDLAEIPVVVGQVNDAPSFTAGPNQTSIPNAEENGDPIGYVVDPWATAISAGPGEGSQTVSFTVSNSNNQLFGVQPSVGADGVLRFTPDPAQTGTATVTVRITDDGGTANGGTDTSAPQTFTITTVPPGPAITSIAPATLKPGESATLTGRQFSTTAANNVVTIGGVTAPVTEATATSLTVTVPCVPTGAGVPVKAVVDGVDTNTVSHPLQVIPRQLARGEATVITDPAEIGCNELASAAGPGRYVVSVFNSATSPSANAPFQLKGNVAGAVTPDVAPGRAAAAPRSDELAGPGAEASGDAIHGDDGAEALAAPGEDAHDELAVKNREQHRLLSEEFGTAGVKRRGAPRDSLASDLPSTRQFRVSDINASNICNSYYVASATRVYAEGKLVIYEDDATPAGLKAASNPAMADYYDKIGDQFNADMEPVVRNNFGDILRRDAVTDNNGVMVALSTPRLNNSFSGVAGFVVSCDQFPNDDTGSPAVGGPYTGSGLNGASNFGEFFYVYQPTVVGTGYTGATPDNWYRTVRSTFIHESKHVASMAARTANGAPLEEPWLEEGTARMAEELWARGAVYGVPWKGNTGYGTAAAPNSLYCDARPGAAECDALPARPASIMQRHFTSLYTLLFGTNARLLSPFGATASDNASYWYATSWSLLRYAIDRYGTSDAAFLTALTDSTSTGTANLAARTGVATDRLLGGWSLALAVDDYPGLLGASADVQIPTWNFRSIFAGMNADFPSTYSLPYPQVPVEYGFGPFSASAITTLRGGGFLSYQISGTQTEAQLLQLTSNTGGAPASTLRLAITRVE
ncbi:Ig-like domain-containing protein [Nocardioides dubius]|uniref:Ig-like domain-containing protein n=1 Tax=Nocardioides dubius TaxID=317019 RepID=UPI0031D1B0B1